MDQSETMIKKAQEQYSNIEFIVYDALALPFESQFDVIFSNAVFHWIKDHETLLDNINKVLKPKGLLVCEFGASGNVATIENAFIKVCHDLGYEYKPKLNYQRSRWGNLLVRLSDGDSRKLLI